MLLAIDTATRIMSLALHDGRNLLAEMTWHTANNHTAELAPAIQDILRRCDTTMTGLTAVGVSTGPGSFTGLRIGVALFAGALILAATGVLPIAVAIVSAAVAMILLGIISLKEAYDSIDWPVIVLLGAMIPVGSALELSGGAQTITDGLLAVGRQAPPVVALAIILIGTMTLSDLINNAAAAVLVAPIALHVAEGLGVSSDPFLMAVAIGASCAFLTPIGHQSNTLVMGPGGYHFGDYWRVGLPLEILIVAVALPLLLIFWPL